jgi:hypothetical protein
MTIRKERMNMENIKEIPAAIPIAVKFMQQSFGGTEVEIVGEAYRLPPSEDAPAGALGCDVHVKIPGHEMQPVKLFLRNSIAENMAFNAMGGDPQLAQMVANEIVFECIRPEYEKIKEKKK